MEGGNLFRTKSVWSLIVRMSIPALVSILVMLLYNMTDMYFVARTGDDAQVAAVSLVMPAFTVLMAISTMLGNGACTLIAQALGGEDRERARTCSSLCVWGCAGFGLAFALLCFVFCGPLLDFLGANDDMRTYARLYLLVLAAGAPIILLNHSLGSVIRGEGAAKQGMAGGLVSTGDVIDHMEWKTKIRCDGVTGGFTSAALMFAVGIAQGLFNLGLMATGYAQPQQIGTGADGVALYADQAAAATGWINFAYQGTYIVMGLLVFAVFLFLFDLEKHLPQVSRELQERKVAECAALGIEYIPTDELERREIREQERVAEENRIKELKEKCAKQGLDFDKENQKVLDKRAAKAARKAKK